MTSKLTREKAQWLHDACEEAAAAGIKLTMNPNELLMFTSYALAAMGSEPVAYTDERNLGYIDRGRETAYLWGKQNSEAGDVPLYRHAQPASERDQVRITHAEWSQATFGNVGPVGPLKHLSKEALEAAAAPGDLSEWADMQFLMWDAQRRAGITDEQITQAMIDKLAVNKQREWPEPKDGEPRQHIKAQPAPVVMDDTKLRELFDSWFASDCSFDLSPEASEADNIAWRESYWYVWQRCRAAMLQELKKSAGTEAICRSDENVQVLHTKSPAQSDCCPAQNQGWIPVSERMPEKGQAVLVYRPKAHEGGDSDVRVAVYGRHNFEHGFGCYWEPSHWMPLPAAPQEVGDA